MSDIIIRFLSINKCENRRSCTRCWILNSRPLIQKLAPIHSECYGLFTKPDAEKFEQATLETLTKLGSLTKA